MRFSRVLGATTALALAAGMVACSSDDSNEPTEDTNSAASSAEGFPIEVEHVYGVTEIPENSERVATVAWANHEVPLAMDIVPVGMSKVSWGDDDGNGILPWVEDKLDELGGEEPVLFDETDGIDFEAVADTQPDVILAGYSGLTQEEYDTLSKIAPTIAFPKDSVAWGTSVDDMITINSEALGLSDQGEALIEDLDSQAQAALDENPELKDKKVMFAFFDPTDLSQFGYYTSHDTRPGFLEGLGLPTPEVVEEASAQSDDFYAEISSEAADQLQDVDIIVTYGDPDGDLIEQLQADPLLNKIPAIAEGNIVILEDDSPLAASANPSPLSIPWGISEYFALLNSTNDSSN